MKIENRSISQDKRYLVLRGGVTFSRDAYARRFAFNPAEFLFENYGHVTSNCSNWTKSEISNKSKSDDHEMLLLIQFEQFENESKAKFRTV